eukprot:TRINITY_DN1548_c0_g2_i2.p1 TRINITY_DN1548_c0_g2~~TRINITY_DN1548_c0_g2_i2.p1  ORF type:complete len:367 (+),score=55.49 TRINITY_DN1548_c0_g2_i2:108-1208(+)
MHSMPDRVLQRVVLENIAFKLGIKHWEDWYYVSSRSISDNGGRMLLSIHGNSKPKLLAWIYPEHKWNKAKFSRKPQHHWEDPKFQREFMEKLAKDLGFSRLEDWYKVKAADFIDNGGTTLLGIYGNSPSRVIRTLYDKELDWKEWKFEHLSRNCWDDAQNVKEALEFVGQSLGVRHLEDWYRVSPKQVTDLGFKSLIARHGTLHQLLVHAFPEHSWDKRNMIFPGKSQHFLFKSVRELFPSDVDVHFEYQHPTISFPSEDGTRQSLITYDIFLPKLSLAFEYQGEQHYHNHLHGKLPDQQRTRDEQKRALSAKNGITLIEVPYWWNRKLGSLRQTILSVRPELNEFILKRETTEAIPTHPPPPHVR